MLWLLLLFWLFCLLFTTFVVVDIGFDASALQISLSLFVIVVFALVWAAGFAFVAVDTIPGVRLKFLLLLILVPLLLLSTILTALLVLLYCRRRRRRLVCCLV